MDDPNQDANPTVDSSATEETQTQTNPQGVGSAPSTDTSTQLPSSQQQDANQGAGVESTQLPPKDNLVGEIRRKVMEELSPMIQATVREAMLGSQPQQAAPQQQTQPEMKYQGKYSSADLENILRHPDATDYDKSFATRGLAYLDAKQDILKEIDQRDEKRLGQSRQEQALRGIVKDYPQVFNAQTNQWNFSDPLWQNTMRIYNSNDRLRSFGNEGLRVAMDSAYAEMARNGQAGIKKTQVKLNAQQRQIDKNQSQALTAGTLVPGKPQGATNSKSKLMEAWKQNPQDETVKRAVMADLVPKSWLTGP